MQLIQILVAAAFLCMSAFAQESPTTTPKAAAPQHASNESPHFAQCLARHLTAHPVFTAQDVYKFVHQSVAGPGHLIPSEETALAYLQHEIANLEEVSERETLYEELGGEPDLVRLNLRPYAQSGGDPLRLADAMQITAASITLDNEEISRRLGIAASLLSERGFHTESDALIAMRDEYAGRGYPALHHSERYGAAYHPAYRVISRKQAEALAGTIDR